MKTYYVAGIPYSDELYHFGIKGQKWGIRRYQNPDGTYTLAGKERYSQLKRNEQQSFEDMKTKEKEYNKATELKPQYEKDKKAYKDALGKAKTTRNSSDYDSMLQKRDKMLESKKAYKENGTKGALKKSKLEYDQSVWNYKNNANKVNKFIGKQAKYKIGLLSPKAKVVGKKAAIATLAVAGTIGVSYAGVEALLNPISTQRISYHFAGNAPKYYSFH